MTLEPYKPEKLDRLTWRFVDLTSSLRQMSNLMRENDLDGILLHDKKALEWLAKLEDWSREASARLQTAAARQRALHKPAYKEEATKTGDNSR